MTPPGPIDRVFGAIVPRAVDAIDMDDVIGQVDVDHLVSEVDVDAVVQRVDVDALIQRVDVDGLIQRVDVDALIQRVDVDALIQRVDVDALIQRVDVGGLVDRVDADGLIQRVDVDGLIQRVDLDGVLTKVDLNKLLATVDLDALLTGVDLDALLTKVDLNKLLAKVDLDALLTKVDLNTLMEGVDLDALLAKVDIEALMKRAKIDEIVSNASRGIFAKLMDAGRRQLAGLDALLIGVVTRVFRRPRVAEVIMGGTLTGQVAGGISRLAAYFIDAGFISITWGFLVAVALFVAQLITGNTYQTSGRAGPWLIGYAVFAFLYYWIGLAISGRSIGKGLVGLRVVAVNGEPITPGRAAIRTIVYPFSFILGLGLIPIVTGKQRRALHDFAGGDKVLYDWGDRPAELPAPLTDWVRRRAESSSSAVAPDLEGIVVPQALRADQPAESATPADDSSARSA